MARKIRAPYTDVEIKTDFLTPADTIGAAAENWGRNLVIKEIGDKREVMQKSIALRQEGAETSRYPMPPVAEACVCVCVCVCVCACVRASVRPSVRPSVPINTNVRKDVALSTATAVRTKNKIKGQGRVDSS